MNSFICAYVGLKEIVKREQNIKIQTIIGVIVIFAGFFFHVSANQFAIIIILITQILALETFNSALEIYIDKVHPEYDKNIGLVKDILATAVLISVIGAVFIGGLIFYLPILNFLGL